MFIWTFLLGMTVLGEAEGAILQCAGYQGDLARNGEEYFPWEKDPCKSCVCDGGFPVKCRTLPCAGPPSNCRHVVHAEGCCKFICLDRFLHQDRENTSQKDNCTDVAIIGAGFAGAYMTWLLRNKNITVDVYEYSNRIGGHLYTTTLPDIPDINIELGRMRFHLDMHPKLYKLVKTLGLDVAEFDEDVNGDTLYYLRSKQLNEADLRTDKLPYNLRNEERGATPRELQWKLFTKNTNYSNRSRRQKSNVEQVHFTTKDGLLLRDQSFETVVGRVASSEAANYLRDANGNDHLFGPSCASIQFPTGNPKKPPTQNYLTLEKGMDYLPKILFKNSLEANRKRLHFNHRLTKLTPLPSGHYELTLKQTTTKNDGYTRDIYGKDSFMKRCAKKVILAVPKMALESITWRSFKKHPRYQRYLSAITDIPTVKIYLGYRSSWWENIAANVSHIITDLPVRNVFPGKISNKTGHAILLAVFKEGDVSYWKRLARLGKANPNMLRTPYVVTNQIINHVRRHLAEILKVKIVKIPEPISGAMYVWEDFPYGGAGNVWLPGYDWNEVRRVMTRPSPKDDVFIIGSAFSSGDNQMEIEGAMQRTDEMFKKYFK